MTNEWEELDKRLDVLLALENVRRQVEQDKQERAKRDAEWAAEVEAYHQGLAYIGPSLKRLGPRYCFPSITATADRSRCENLLSGFL